MEILTSPFCSVVVQSEVILTNVLPSARRTVIKAKASHQSRLSLAPHSGHFVNLPQYKVAGQRHSTQLFFAQVPLESQAASVVSQDDHQLIPRIVFLVAFKFWLTLP